jgi:hypothetical protein
MGATGLNPALFADGYAGPPSSEVNMTMQRTMSSTTTVANVDYTIIYPPLVYRRIPSDVTYDDQAPGVQPVVFYDGSIPSPTDDQWTIVTSQPGLQLNFHNLLAGTVDPVFRESAVVSFYFNNRGSWADIYDITTDCRKFSQSGGSLPCSESNAPSTYVCFLFFSFMIIDCVFFSPIGTFGWCIDETWTMGLTCGVNSV